MNNGYVFKTHWTRSMLFRPKELDHLGFTDEMLMSLKGTFNAPAAVQEVWQERAFLKAGECMADNLLSIFRDSMMAILTTCTQDLEPTLCGPRQWKRWLSI